MRAILSEFHAKIRRRLQSWMHLKVMQHKSFSYIGAVKSWQIFAKSRAKLKWVSRKKAPKIDRFFAKNAPKIARLFFECLASAPKKQKIGALKHLSCKGLSEEGEKIQKKNEKIFAFLVQLWLKGTCETDGITGP